MISIRLLPRSSCRCWGRKMCSCFHQPLSTIWILKKKSLKLLWISSNDYDKDNDNYAPLNAIFLNYLFATLPSKFFQSCYKPLSLRLLHYLRNSSLSYTTLHWSFSGSYIQHLNINQLKSAPGQTDMLLDN